MALAAFERAGHARQGVLHDPDITSVLNCASCLPRLREPADRPWSPDTRIRGAKQRNGPASCSGSKVRDRSVGSDIDARLRQQAHHLRPLHLMNGDDVAPDFLKVAPLGLTRTTDRNHGKAAFRETG